MLRAIVVIWLEMLAEILKKMVGNRQVWSGLSAEVEEHGDKIKDMYRLSVQHFFNMG